MTASREFMRRPSHRTVTSSGAGGRAWRIPSNHSSPVITGCAAKSAAYLAPGEGAAHRHPGPGSDPQRGRFRRAASADSLEPGRAPDPKSGGEQAGCRDCHVPGSHIELRRRLTSIGSSQAGGRPCGVERQGHRRVCRVVHRADQGLVSATQVAQSVAALREEGPTLGRPLVDRIQGSRIPHLKELRPGSGAGRRSGCCSRSTRPARRCCCSAG